MLNLYYILILFNIIYSICNIVLNSDNGVLFFFFSM